MILDAFVRAKAAPKPRAERSGSKSPTHSARCSRVRPSRPHATDAHGTHKIFNPFVKLKSDGVQNVALLRYHT